MKTHLLSTCFLLVSCSVLSAVEKPNVIVILTDDQGWGDLGHSGNKNLDTPNVDSLARDGASFDRFYVCPVCSPTRAEFLTGRHHPRGGVFSTSAGGERLDLDEKTIAETFKAAGYATAAFGKWHNGMQPPYHPNARGFDEYYGFCSGHWGDYFGPPLEHNGKLVRGEGFIIDDFTNRAIQFINNVEKSPRQKPFFVYLPYNTPHSPMQVPDQYWNKFADKRLAMHNRDPSNEKPLHMRCALAMCENIDDNVGRLLETLEDLGIAADTIVLYFCDNGPNGVRWNGGMKGRKGSTDEGGVRSPLFVRWPARIAAGKEIPWIAAAIDLLPTLAELAEIEVVGKLPLDGVSLAPLLLGDGKDWPKRYIPSHWRGRISIRSQRHRLDHKGALFDMVNDPGQDTNIARDHPAIVAAMTKAADEYRRNVLSELNLAKRRFPLGHPDYRYTQIPARDGTAYGNIKRSNKFPNNSFFFNWRSVDDKITWPVEVLADGNHEVELYYTCPAADVGSTIELTCGESRVTARVAEAHDPPLRGGEHDRSPRMESYVKDFAPLKMGVIDLKKGPADLTLQATEIPGGQALDFRLLMFKRLEQ
jgi:arylsulfatase A-like enzyme